MSNYRCPLCNSENLEKLLDLDCGNFDGSTLYRRIRIVCCDGCGHIFNELSGQELKDLEMYYNNEYAPTNLGAVDNSGDRPGSVNANTLSRYAQLNEFISPYLSNKNVKILDVGCAMGGFLSSLKEKGFNNLTGIDLTERYVDHVNVNGVFNAKVGSAEKIPYDNESFEFILLDQVLEHLLNPRAAFREAARVLKKGGLLCLGVPNTFEYRTHYYFDFFWFIMREHIQHFDIDHLEFLAASEGFELVAHETSELSMMSDKMILPNLSVLFKYNGIKKDIKSKLNLNRVKEQTKQYIKDDYARLKEKKAKIVEVASKKTPVYVWGIGREFLYLYQNAGLNQCNIFGLIDMNPYKQRTFTVDNRKLESSDILAKIGNDVVLIITAIAHKEKILEAIKKINYKGLVLDL